MSKMYRQIVSILLTVFLFAGLADADHVKLFVLTGQSNSLGTTAGKEDDPSPGSDPADNTSFFTGAMLRMP